MLTNIPIASKHPNITEVNHGLSYFENAKRNMFEVRKNENFDGLKKTILSFTKNLYKMQAVTELYERRKEFDLIVVNYKFNEVRIQGTKQDEARTKCSTNKQCECLIPRWCTLSYTKFPSSLSLRQGSTLTRVLCWEMSSVRLTCLKSCTCRNPSRCLLGIASRVPFGSLLQGSRGGTGTLCPWFRKRYAYY